MGAAGHLAAALEDPKCHDKRISSQKGLCSDLCLTRLRYNVNDCAPLEIQAMHKHFYCLCYLLIEVTALFRLSPACVVVELSDP